MERIFCANCGHYGGLITAEWSPHVYWICNKCESINGEPPGAVKADEAAVRGRSRSD